MLMITEEEEDEERRGIGSESSSFESEEPCLARQQTFTDSSDSCHSSTADMFSDLDDEPCKPRSGGTKTVSRTVSGTVSGTVSRTVSKPSGAPVELDSEATSTGAKESGSRESFRSIEDVFSMYFLIKEICI